MTTASPSTSCQSADCVKGSIRSDLSEHARRAGASLHAARYGSILSKTHATRRRAVESGTRQRVQRHGAVGVGEQGLQNDVVQVIAQLGVADVAQRLDPAVEQTDGSYRPVRGKPHARRINAQEKLLRAYG